MDREYTSFMRIRGRAPLTAAVYGVYSLAGAVYWSAVQMYAVDVGLGKTMAMAIYSLPWIVGVISVPAGRLADIYGDRRRLGLASAVATGLSVAPVVASQEVPVVLLAGLLNTAAWSMLAPVLFEEAMATAGEEEGAGAMTMTGSAGWTAGTVMAGAVYAEWGLGGAAALSMLLQLLSLPLVSAGLDGERKASFLDALSSIPLRPGGPIHLAALVLFESFFTAYLGSYELWCILLYEKLGDPRLYGVILGMAGAVSAAAAPLASWSGKKYGLASLLAASAAALLGVNAVFAVAEDPVILAAAMLLPLWPFTNVLSYTYARRLWGGATASGIVNALWNVAGLLAPAIGVIGDNMGAAAALAASSAVSLASLSGLHVYAKRYIEPGVESGGDHA